MAYSPKTSWYSVVYGDALQARPERPLEGPLAVSLEIRLPLPKSAPKRRPPYWAAGHVGDVDNFAKAVYDAMTQARWWADDCQICSATTSKRYAQHGEEPGCTVEVNPLPLEWAEKTSQQEAAWQDR